MSVPGLADGSGGGKVDGPGWRGFGSRGSWEAIVTHIHEFLTVEAGIRKFLVGGGWGFRLSRRDWSSLACSGEGTVVIATIGAVGWGDGAAAGNGLRVAAFGACGVLAPMGRTIVVKRTVGAGGVFLGASGIGVSESVAVGALDVAVGLRSLLDLETPREEEERGSEDGNVVGVNGDNHRSGLLGKPSSSVLVKVPGRADRDCLRVVNGVFDESKELFLVCW